MPIHPPKSTHCTFKFLQLLLSKPLAFTSIISNSKFPLVVPKSALDVETVWAVITSHLTDPHLHPTCDPGNFGEVNKCITAAKKGSKTQFSLLSHIAVFLAHTSAVMPQFADLHHSYVCSLFSQCFILCIQLNSVENEANKLFQI